MISQEECQKTAIYEYKQGNYVKCINICNDAIQNNFHTGPIYNVKSLAAMALKRYDEALDAIEEAVLLSPENETYQKNKIKIETIINRNKVESDLEFQDEDFEDSGEDGKQPQYISGKEKRGFPFLIIGFVFAICMIAGLLFILFPMLFHDNVQAIQPADNSKNYPSENSLLSSVQRVGDSSVDNIHSFNDNNELTGAQSDVQISSTSPKYRNYEGTQSLLFELVASNVNLYDQTERDVHPFLEGMEILYSHNNQPPVKFPLVEIEEYPLNSNEVSITLPLANQLFQAGDDLFLIIKPKMAQGDVKRIFFGTEVYDESPYPVLLRLGQLSEGIMTPSAEERMAMEIAIKQKFLQ